MSKEISNLKDGIIPKSQILGRRGLSGSTAIVIFVLTWILYTFLYTTLVYFTNPQESNFTEILIGQFFWNVLRATYIIPVWILMDRWLLHQSGILSFSVHVLLALAYSWFALKSLVWIITLATGEQANITLGGAMSWILLEGVTIYLIQIVAYRSWRQLKLLKEKERQAEELNSLNYQQELKALKAQLNPHFLFNTLNTISASVGSDTEQTRDLIATLSELLRYSLDTSGRELVTLGEELDFIDKFLAIEKARFPDKFVYESEVDKELRNVLIPPMTLQPLIENAIKHGIGPNTQTGHVKLSAKKEEELVQLLIENSMGAGSTRPSHRKGIGLFNTKSRLEAIVGTQVDFQSEQLGADSFHVRFKLPLSNEVS